MFTRADVLWLQEREKDFPLHALKYHWEGFEPGLTCFDTVSDEVVEFDLEDVGFLVGRRRTCIGQFDGDRYIECPVDAEVAKFAQCARCSGESFIPVQECIFEPRCDGEICDHQFCRREHVLYLAFYNTNVKIGMSSSRRVERRLIEQGADAYAVIGSFGTRRKAREAEKDISSRLRIPQSFRQDVLLQNLARPLDVQGVEARHAGLRATLAEAYRHEVEELRWLEGYPLELPLRQVPRLQETRGRHKGSFLGIKGKWMVYESGDVRALNLSDLPARHIAREPP